MKISILFKLNSSMIFLIPSSGVGEYNYFSVFGLVGWFVFLGLTVL